MDPETRSEPVPPQRAGFLRGDDPAGLLGIGLGSSAGADPLKDWTPPPVGALAGSFPAFDLVRMLGRGGMGAVYLARHRNLDRMAAIKVLPPEACGEEAFIQRFHREARALARLSHPGIVAVHDFGTTADGLPFLVMEYVEGASLAELLRGGRLDAAQALSIVSAICEALAYAHQQGVIHRDIKPSNILVDRGGRVKVADFGLAKLEHPASAGGALAAMRTMTGVILGTPAYAAPEQLKAPAEADHRADIYSLGVMLYEMLTGELPRGVFAPPSAKAPLDPRLDAVVHKAMQERPEARYQQAGEMRRDLTTISAAPAPPRRARSRRKPAPALFLLLLAFPAAAALFLLLSNRAPSRPAPGAVPATASAPPKPAGPAPAPPAPAAPRLSAAPATAAPAANSAPAAVSAPAAEAVREGKRYRLFTTPLPWGAAQDFARSQGGHLASAPDPATAGWITATFAPKAPQGFFLGGQCWTPGGFWEWADGSAWGHTAWRGEPPIYGALKTASDGSWQAVPFDEPLPFLVQTPAAAP